MYATEMQLKVLFEKKLHGRPDFKKKKTTKACLFRHYFLCLHSRVIENKRDEFGRKKNMKIQSGGETMSNVSVQQGENEGQ